MKTRINESKTLTKHISRECNFQFDGRKCNSNPKWNQNKCYYEGKNPRKLQMREKIVPTKKNFYNKNFYIKNCFKKF